MTSGSSLSMAGLTSRRRFGSMSAIRADIGRATSDTLEYTFTVDNPTMWTRAWTAMINWKQSKGEVLEYACHEGNYSLPGMLAGARADEAAAR
jgi:hypothetical protein